MASCDRQGVGRLDLARLAAGGSVEFGAENRTSFGCIVNFYDGLG